MPYCNWQETWFVTSLSIYSINSIWPCKLTLCILPLRAYMLYHSIDISKLPVLCSTTGWFPMHDDGVVLGPNGVTIYRSRHWCWVANSQTVEVYIIYKLSAAVHLFWADCKPLFLNNTIIQWNHNVKYMDSRSGSYHVEFQLHIAPLFEPLW